MNFYIELFVIQNFIQIMKKNSEEIEISYIFLAFANNMARSLAAIVDSMKKNLQTD